MSKSVEHRNLKPKKSRAIPPSKWTEGKNGRRMLYKPKINQEPS